MCRPERYGNKGIVPAVKSENNQNEYLLDEVLI